MEDGLLSLKWNNHKSTFFHILSNLRKKETYTDATLACDGKFFPVHKLVMSTCSDYFSEVFERTTCKSPVVILKDIRHHDLEALLDYMYLGEVDVKQSELAALIKAAECLRIKGLAVPDEDPTLSHKKTTHVPESRASPSGKRSRRESGEAESNHHFTSHHKVRRSLSPPSTSSSRSHSSLAPTSVPSQSGISDAQPQVPSHGMPPPVYSDSRSSMPDFSSNDAQKHQDQSLVPVDMIKVEVEEGSSNPPLRQRDSLPEQGERRKNSLTEGAIGTDSGGGSGGREKEPISNNFSEYTNHPTEIEKEEHDQLDTYNGSEQVPGPSGVQGGSQMMNWGEEEGNFPHNLFGGEDSSHQQVLIHFEGKSREDIADLKDPDYRPHSQFPSGSYRRSGVRRGTLVYYGCPMCPKGFTDKHKWTRHIITHTGEKPYACSICPCRYTRNDKLKEHLRRVHRIR